GRKGLEEALMESDRRKDEFLATLAHELRNPLAPVRYATKVLELKEPVTPEMQWAVQLIERQARHMSRLIDDLLDISRVSRNALELRRESVELKAIMAAAVETIRPVLGGEGLDPIRSVPATPIYVDGDPVRLAQVFCNLLDNAAKYGKQSEGGGKIWLSAEQEGDY